jgi:hypothetical protein
MPSGCCMAFNSYEAGLWPGACTYCCAHCCGHDRPTRRCCNAEPPCTAGHDDTTCSTSGVCPPVSGDCLARVTAGLLVAGCVLVETGMCVGSCRAWFSRTHLQLCVSWSVRHHSHRRTVLGPAAPAPARCVIQLPSGCCHKHNLVMYRGKLAVCEVLPCFLAFAADGEGGVNDIRQDLVQHPERLRQTVHAIVRVPSSWQGHGAMLLACHGCTPRYDLAGCSGCNIRASMLSGYAADWYAVHLMLTAQLRTTSQNPERTGARVCSCS